MKTPGIIKYLIFLILIFNLFSCDSDKIDAKKIKGKWQTIGDVKNSQITFTIGDSTIITEFFWDNGIKKTLFDYKIKEKKRTYLLIESKNTFGLSKIDTFSFDHSLLKINTNIGKTLFLEKIR
jgi:hypothetical protein